MTDKHESTPDKTVAAEMKMDQNDWTAIFTLLAITIVVDDRVYKEEVDCFLAQVTHLANEIPSDTLVTEKLAFDWFFAQQAEIRAHILGPQADIYIVRTLHRLLDSPYHKPLLRTMKAVSLADSDFHVNEVGLIDLAVATWGLKPSDLL